MPVVNNITRLLDVKNIKYTVFETPAEKLGALETARILQIPPQRVYKTIVVIRQKQGKPILAVIPGSAQADLKCIAAAVGEKKINLPTEKEAERLTGLQAGGISPLALINRGFQVIIDSSALNFAEIHISGGQRGMNLALSPNDLAGLTHAIFASISNDNQDLINLH